MINKNQNNDQNRIQIFNNILNSDLVILINNETVTEKNFSQYKGKSELLGILIEHLFDNSTINLKEYDALKAEYSELKKYPESDYMKEDSDMHFKANLLLLKIYFKSWITLNEDESKLILNKRFKIFIYPC